MNGTTYVWRRTVVTGGSHRFNALVYWTAPCTVCGRSVDRTDRFTSRDVCLDRLEPRCEAHPR